MIGNQNGQVELLNGQIALQTGQMNNLHGIIEHQNKIIDNLNDKFEEQNTEVTELRLLYANEKSKTEVLENQLAEVKANQAAKDEELENEKAKIVGLETDFAEIKSLLENQVANSAQVSTKIEAIESEVKVHTETFADLKPTLDSQLQSGSATKVLFAAQRTSGEVTKGNFITYSNLHTNLGAGFDKDSGLFTVPTSGIYRFYFSAMTDIDDHYAYIRVYKNDAIDFYIHYNNRDSNAFPHELLSYIWTMQLTQGDRIRLKVDNTDLFVGSSYPLFHSGELLIESE